MVKATLTRGLQILEREGITPQEFLRMDPFEAMRIPGLGKHTYLTLREYFRQQKLAGRKRTTRMR